MNIRKDQNPTHSTFTHQIHDHSHLIQTHITSQKAFNLQKEILQWQKKLCMYLSSGLQGSNFLAQLNGFCFLQDDI